jgi:hypothetical protein
MAGAARHKVSPTFDQNVFINCPFDDAFMPIFRALVFAVFECGLIPRSAQEVYDTGVIRIEKIESRIKDCRWGIHDISRTELNANNLPRFNMPLEPGLFLGARRYGRPPQDRKSCLVLDRDKHRYQAFISDIAGQDIAAHGNQPDRAIKAVRDWMTVSRPGARKPAGANAIRGRFDRFNAELPAICSRNQLEVVQLTFVEYADLAYIWLKTDLAGLR